MHPVQHNRDGRDIVEQLLEVLDRLLLCEVQAELAQHLFMDVPVFDVRDVCVDHQGNQVQDEVGALPQDAERSEAKILEACVVDGLHAAHCIIHLFADLDGRCERFGVASENVTEVDYGAAVSMAPGLSGGIRAMEKVPCAIRSESRLS